MDSDFLAYDKDTVRRLDEDGRLHVSTTNISKSAINPYYGREIPDYQALGLDANTVYQLFRDPEELKKAASTFNNIPLLSKHIPVSAQDHQPDSVVGSTGTDAQFDGTYLKNSLVIWAADAITGIDNNEQRELSCAYRYRADMTPGDYQGTHYDGVMRDIRGNHVALVAVGRAGRDVIVGDAKMDEEGHWVTIEGEHVKFSGEGKVISGGGGSSQKEAKQEPKEPEAPKQEDKKPAASETDVRMMIKEARKSLSENAIISANKAIINYNNSLEDGLKGSKSLAFIDENANLTPQKDKAFLSIADKKEGDLKAKTEKEAAEKREKLLAMQNKSKLATDSDPIIDVPTFLQGLLSAEDFTTAIHLMQRLAVDSTTNPGAATMSDLPEDQAAEEAEETQETEPEVTLAAMDAAIAQAEQKTILKMRAIQAAEKAVFPYVGELVAQDSAEDVYKTALTALGVALDDVHPSAYKHILAAQPKPSAAPVTQAMDEANYHDFAEKFPAASLITQLG